MEHPDFFQAECEVLVDETEEAEELEALSRAVVSEFEQYIRVNKKIPPEVLITVNQIEEPNKLADTVVQHLALKLQINKDFLKYTKFLRDWNAFIRLWKAR